MWGGTAKVFHDAGNVVVERGMSYEAEGRCCHVNEVGKGGLVCHTAKAQET